MTDPKDEDGRDSRRQGRAYQGAFEAVFAILIASGIGYWADERFGTTPRWLLVGMAIGFCSFVLRMVKLGHTLYEETPGQQDRERDDER